MGKSETSKLNDIRIRFSTLLMHGYINLTIEMNITYKNILNFLLISSNKFVSIFVKTLYVFGDLILQVIARVEHWGKEMTCHLMSYGKICYCEKRLHACKGLSTH